MRPVIVAGARPNFMKIAPILRAFDQAGVSSQFIHTGQHYDTAMSDDIFRDLRLRAPDANFDVRSGSHAVQTANVMRSFDAWLDEHPDVDTLVVVGDVNSTLACTLVASKRLMPVAHVEAGLRSGDRTMPEETNRLVVDALAGWLLTPSADADANLLAEGVPRSAIHLVGNVMVDSLLDALDRLSDDSTIARLGLAPRSYVLVTLHRPALVDDPEKLAGMLRTMADLSGRLPVVFPAHPRTRARIEALGVILPKSLILTPPLSYLDFVSAQATARLVITDSGGVQEETTCLGVPCVTARDNTERPITVSHGTNHLAGTDPDAVAALAVSLLDVESTPRRPPLWDGGTAARIVTCLLERPPRS